MFGQLFTSVLYSLGKTNYIAIKTVIGNIILVAGFSLTLYDVIPISIYSVSIIFGIGLFIGSVTSTFFYFYAARKISYEL